MIDSIEQDPGFRQPSTGGRKLQSGLSCLLIKTWHILTYLYGCRGHPHNCHRDCGGGGGGGDGGGDGGSHLLKSKEINNPNSYIQALL